MFSFSTCWNSHRHTDGRAMLAEIRALGFEYAELGHGVRLTLVEGIQQAVAAGEIKISSLHNFCPLPVGVMHASPDYYLPSSLHDQERQLAVRHTIRTIDFAASLGAKAVVLHLGVVGMRNRTRKLLEMMAEGRAEKPRFFRRREKALLVRERKRGPYLDRVFRSLDEIVPRARDAGVRLGIETRLRLEEIPDSDETAEITARFGPETVAYWHDVGHAQVKENLGLTTHEFLLKRFCDKTAGMHLQDFAPPEFDHLPPECGTFDFQRLTPFVKPGMVFAWEIHPQTPADQIGENFKRAHEILQRTATT
jgi:sugar phosphate isomerase/epimerase